MILGVSAYFVRISVILLRGHAEVLGHLMHSVFVSDTTQIKPPPSQLIAPLSRRAVFLLFAGRFRLPLPFFTGSAFYTVRREPAPAGHLSTAGGRLPFLIDPGGHPSGYSRRGGRRCSGAGYCCSCRARRRMRRCRRLAAVNAVSALPQVLLVL